MSTRLLLDLPAPAKLNLFLHINGRRADGYHLIQSAFMLIDWCDTLDIEWRSGPGITRDDTLGHTLPEQDLVVRAAHALQQATGCQQGAHIRLSKHIPMEAGMGGGSSDAATCLLALNRLWSLHLDRTALMRIGLTLGADVPFFLYGNNAWVEGIGEQLQPLALPQARFLVLKPPTGVSTAQIFQSPQLTRSDPRATIEDFVANSSFDFGKNTLQPVAEALCTDIRTGLQWMQDRGLHGRMTGSGSALFARLDGADPESDWPPGWTGRCCNNLNVHPLTGWC